VKDSETLNKLFNYTKQVNFETEVKIQAIKCQLYFVGA